MIKYMLKGDWNVLKGKLKQLYGNLTGDELIVLKGREEELLGRFQQKVGRIRQDIRNILEKL